MQQSTCNNKLVLIQSKRVCFGSLFLLIFLVNFVLVKFRLWLNQNNIFYRFIFLFGTMCKAVRESFLFKTHNCIIQQLTWKWTRFDSIKTSSFALRISLLRILFVNLLSRFQNRVSNWKSPVWIMASSSWHTWTVLIEIKRTNVCYFAFE